MIYVNRKELTVHEAKELSHLGFIVKFVTYTVNGLLFDIYVKGE